MSKEVDQATCILCAYGLLYFDYQFTVRGGRVGGGLTVTGLLAVNVTEGSQFVVYYRSKN